MIYTQELGVGDEVVVTGDGAPTTVSVYWNGVGWVVSEHSVEEAGE